MTKYLDGGITRNGEGYDGTEWNILGQRYFPKATCASTFAFETNSAPGQFVPVHIHPHQDEFILVQEGQLELKLDGPGRPPAPATSSGCRAASRTATSTSPTPPAAPSSGSRRRAG